MCRRPVSGLQRGKVFCFFFSKKKRFLPPYACLLYPHSLPTCGWRSRAFFARAGSATPTLLSATVRRSPTSTTKVVGPSGLGKPRRPPTSQAWFGFADAIREGAVFAGDIRACRAAIGHRAGADLSDGLVRDALHQEVSDPTRNDCSPDPAERPSPRRAAGNLRSNRRHR